MRLRACHRQEFHSLSVTPGKNVRRKDRVWGVLRGMRGGATGGEKTSWSRSAREPLVRARRPSRRGAATWHVVLGGSVLGGSSSSTRQYEHASALRLVIQTLSLLLYSIRHVNQHYQAIHSDLEKNVKREIAW